MDKKLLKEEIERIHTITYGKKVVLDETVLDDILNFVGLGKKEKKDDPKKADFLQGTINDLVSTLKSIKSPITQGDKNKQKEIEAVQVALCLVMDKNPLPKSGVDGSFGSETADAIKTFKKENNLEKKKEEPKDEVVNEGLKDWFKRLVDRISGSGEEKETITPDFINVLLKKLKIKNVEDSEITPFIDTYTKSKISTKGNWVNITIELLRKHEGFSPDAKWDENAFRGGYGSDKKLVDGKLERATKDTTWTRQEADQTLEYEIINSYAPIIKKQLGDSNWKKLNDRQKAALVSMGYNVGPHFLTVKNYGKKIKSAIELGDMETAAQNIEKGPTTGAVSGKSYAGLKRRRKEEAAVFLS